MVVSCLSPSTLHFLPASDPPYKLLEDHPHLNLVAKCPDIPALKQIHSLIIKTGLHNTVFAQSKLIHFCALSPSPDLSYALSLFRSLQRPSLFIWNTLIRAHSLTPSLHLYARMLHSGLHPNSHTLPFLFKSCARAGATHEGKQLHAHALKLALHSHPHVHTSLIHMYSQVGELRHARLVFDKSTLRDAVSFTALITGRIQHPSYPFGIHALEGGLKEFFLAVAKTVLSATMKYAAPATANIIW
ncbi:Pentatricopeptide repeat-containing protein [Spatholobus suberectus]|nr:Pentatricopeptide repeat-containing protein [Spatholobus suberectus]